MGVYKEMYSQLFNELTDTINELDHLKLHLVQAQQSAEERFLNAEEEEK